MNKSVQARQHYMTLCEEQFGGNMKFHAQLHSQVFALLSIEAVNHSIEYVCGKKRFISTKLQNRS